MVKNKSLELYKLIINLITIYEKESEKIYNKLSPLLQEQSHSFGFKPFSDLLDKLVKDIDIILNNEDFSYYIFEKQERKEKLLHNSIIKSLFNKEKELLKLINDQLTILNKEKLKIGNLFKMFLPNLQEDKTKYSFKPIEDIVKHIKKELEIIKKKDKKC